MPRLTSEQLLEAKRRKAEERRQEEEQRRLEAARQEAKLQEDERQARERMAQEQDLYKRHTALASYVGGIYDEVNKLSSKRPTDEVSSLMVERANRAIRSAKELLADEEDPFLDEIEEFIPAGDSIEARDVVLTLRQVKDALDRMKNRHFRSWNLLY